MFKINEVMANEYHLEGYDIPIKVSKRTAQFLNFLNEVNSSSNGNYNIDVHFLDNRSDNGYAPLKEVVIKVKDLDANDAKKILFQAVEMHEAYFKSTCLYPNEIVYEHGTDDEKFTEEDLRNSVQAHVFRMGSNPMFLTRGRNVDLDAFLELALKTVKSIIKILSERDNKNDELIIPMVFENDKLNQEMNDLANQNS